MEAASAGDGVVVGDLCSASEEGRAQIVEMAGDEGGMGFFRYAEILFDADVNLLVAALKPAPSARTKGLGFLYFRHSQERAVKFASGRLATLGSGNLEVIDLETRTFIAKQEYQYGAECIRGRSLEYRLLDVLLPHG